MIVPFYNQFLNYSTQMRSNLKVFDFRSAKIHRQALWILGEYCSSPSDIQSVMTEVRQSLGELPIVEDEMKKKSGEEGLEDETVVQRYNNFYQHRPHPSFKWQSSDG